MLQLPGVGPGASDRTRHPLPAGEAREVPSARPRPDPRRGRPRPRPAEQPGGGGPVIEEFRLPDLGEGLPEAELVQWLVAEGDTVTLNQTIAEVETAKAIVELPSPFAGTVSALHAQAGDVVEVGAVLIAFEVAGADPSPTPEPEVAVAASAPAEPADAPAEKATPNLVGYGAAPRAAGRPQRRARAFAASVPSGTADTAVLEAAPHDVLHAPEIVDAPTERRRSTPPVRKLAKDLGVDLALIEPSSETGLITRADVEAYAERVGTAAVATAVEPDETIPSSLAALAADRPRERRIPIRGVRKFTAEAMVRSAFTAPHVTR